MKTLEQQLNDLNYKNQKGLILLRSDNKIIFLKDMSNQFQYYSNMNLYSKVIKVDTIISIKQLLKLLKG